MSRIRVERHDSLLARWEMVFCEAPAALAPHVRGYLGYSETTPGPFQRLEVPSDEVHVILSFGPECRVPERVGSFVAAPHTRHAIVDHDGHQHGVELRLTPLGTHMLLGVPMDELAHHCVELDALLGPAASELIEQVYEAPSWEARFALLDAFLARRLADASPPVPGVEYAWRELSRTHGAVPVSRLVEETGWSRRHLSARFREHVGLTPKVFGRILRFQRARHELGRSDGPSLAEIALDCGYYDQAHLNRDFREFAGRTPSELIAARLPGGGGYVGG
jgi:AraC-like DNA-binding protein